MNRDSLCELFIPQINKDNSVAQYIQLFRILEDYIIEGKLPAGAKLPASRPLSQTLNVSRNTVKAAYELLSAEGYIESRRGAGSFVVDLMNTRLVAQTNNVNQVEDVHETEYSDLLKRLCAQQKPNHYFHDGILAPASPAILEFPWLQWQRAINNAAKDLKFETTSSALGHSELRNQISAYLQLSRGVKCTKENILIFSGSQQAIYFALQLLVNNQESVMVESPSYYGIDGAINAIGAKKIAVDIDNNGFKLPFGSNLDARVAVVTPSRNYPLGYTMSFDRRVTLLDWVNRNNSWVIEDDYDSDFSFDGAPLTCLQGLSRAKRVIYSGTFSRILHHSIRIGYLVVPDELIEPFSLAKKLMHGAMATLPQLALAKFMSTGKFSNHVKRMRKLYGIRRTILKSLIDQHLAEHLTLVQSDGGMHCVYLLGNSLSDVSICQKALKENITIQPLSTYYCGEVKKSGLVIGFAGFDEKQQKEAILILKTIINDSCIYL
jgi:GntR family transcriptional regulator/MocR family aminotransferase